MSDIPWKRVRFVMFVRLGISACGQSSKVNNRNLDENSRPMFARTFCYPRGQSFYMKKLGLLEQYGSVLSESFAAIKCGGGQTVCTRGESYWGCVS